jgi:predicted kinase
MATLFLICGLPGAGKTTLAKQLEQERPALRLCPDEWIETLLADPSDRDELERLRSPVEAVQWEVAARTLMLGVDVVLEWGFWGRDERADFRARGEALGARVAVVFLELSRPELWARLEKRNANLPPGTFPVTEEELDQYISWWEPPSAEELAGMGADAESGEVMT